nr:retrovirus-related Pol polyprotein from transposon TNT 1-94 [Tanacetum cinerariifolium]
MTIPRLTHFPATTLRAGVFDSFVIISDSDNEITSLPVRPILRISALFHHKPKSEDTNQEKLYLLHMDLYGPMRVESVNGKKCGEEVGISHETSVARSPQQNRVVERRNCTLIEVARTMLIYAQAPLFLWAEAVATACFTQNRSIIRLRYGKTPYELMHGKQPDLSFFHVFGALCYPTNDSENVGKLQPKADIGIFIGYAPTKKAFRIYNRRTLLFLIFQPQVFEYDIRYFIFTFLVIPIFLQNIVNHPISHH